MPEAQRRRRPQPQTFGLPAPVRTIRPDLMEEATSLTLAEGIDLGTPVVEAIGAEAPSRFTGSIAKVTVEVR